MSDEDLQKAADTRLETQEKGSTENFDSTGRVAILCVTSSIQMTKISEGRVVNFTVCVRQLDNGQILALIVLISHAERVYNHPLIKTEKLKFCYSALKPREFNNTVGVFINIYQTTEGSTGVNRPRLSEADSC